MALHLAQRGHDVAVHYAGSREGAEDVVSQIRDMGRSAVALQADLLDESVVQRLIPRQPRRWGP
jgi:NAD(P)-dependent dehydrogenase (short-subunit alcohol dehydrogenase family)